MYKLLLREIYKHITTYYTKYDVDLLIDNLIKESKNEY